MKQRQQDFALGLAAIAFLALFLGTVLFLYPMFHEHGYRLEIRFPHDTGLAPLKTGSLVLMGGSLEVGRVVRVGLDSRGMNGQSDVPETVFVVVAEINKDVELYGDCEITTNQPAIGGSGYVDILDVGTPTVQLEQPIAGLPPQSLQSAIGTLSRQLLAPGGMVDHLNFAVDPEQQGSVMYKVLAILDDLEATSQSLKYQLGPDEQQQQTLMAKLLQTLDNLKATTGALREQMATGDNAALLAKVHVALDEVNAALAEAGALVREERPRVQKTLAHISNAAAMLDEQLLTGLVAQLDAGDPTSLIGKVHAAMDEVNAALGDVRTITSEGQRMLLTNRPAVDAAVRNLKSSSDELLHGIQEVSLDPSKMLFGPGEQRGKQLLIFQAARSFADAASALDEAAGRLEAATKTMPTEGPLTKSESDTLQSIHDTVRASFERFKRAEQVLWDELK